MVYINLFSDNLVHYLHMQKESLFKNANIFIVCMAAATTVGCLLYEVLYELYLSNGKAHWTELGIIGSLVLLGLILILLLWAISPYFFLFFLFYKRQAMAWGLGLLSLVVTLTITIFGLKHYVTVIYSPDLQSILSVLLTPLIQGVGCSLISLLYYFSKIF